MWFYAIAGVVILACATLLAGIAARKFPQLSLIDTDAIPKERDAQKKKEIIKDRVDRMAVAWGKRILAALAPIAGRIREAFRAKYRTILDLERQYFHPKPLSAAERREKIAALLAAGAASAKSGAVADAERSFIDVITLDRRNRDAYHALGELYLDAKRYDQAKETITYLVKMSRKARGCIHENGKFRGECQAAPAVHAEFAEHYLDLGLACQALDELSEARLAYEHAVGFAPANPRYLDLLLETCILEGDKEKAQHVFWRLREANPENQKLGAISERIAAIPDNVPSTKRARRASTPT